MSSKQKQRRRVQTKRLKTVSNTYAMSAWLDLEKQMPIRTLTLDDVVKELFLEYRRQTGKPVPMEVGAQALSMVEEIKARYASRPALVQRKFHFLRQFTDLKGIIDGIRNKGEEI